MDLAKVCSIDEIMAERNTYYWVYQTKYLFLYFVRIIKIKNKIWEYALLTQIGLEKTQKINIYPAVLTFRQFLLTKHIKRVDNNLFPSSTTKQRAISNWICGAALFLHTRIIT